MWHHVYRAVFSAAAVALLFTALDYLYLGDLIPNYGPRVDGYHVVKSIAAALTAYFLVLAIYRSGLAGSKGIAHQEDLRLPAAIGLGSAALFVAIFVFSPAAFNQLGSEDALIENISALVALMGAVGFTGAALAARRLPKTSPNRTLTQALAWLCAGTMFLLCMEEISWGQRLLDFSTPESFSGNLQGEVNLHNFYTTPVHTVYRVGGWTILIFLPFLASFGPRLMLLERISNFIPPVSVAALCAPIACFNYNAWPFFPTQVIAASSFMIMLLFLRQARRERPRLTSIFAGAAGLILVAQSIFLAAGDRFLRLWDVTEYQELYIAVGLATMGFVVWHRLIAEAGKTRHAALGTHAPGG